MVTKMTVLQTGTISGEADPAPHYPDFKQVQEDATAIAERYRKAAFIFSFIQQYPDKVEEAFGAAFACKPHVKEYTKKKRSFSFAGIVVTEEDK